MSLGLCKYDMSAGELFLLAYAFDINIAIGNQMKWHYAHTRCVDFGFGVKSLFTLRVMQS